MREEDTLGNWLRRGRHRRAKKGHASRGEGARVRWGSAASGLERRRPSALMWDKVNVNSHNASR